MPETGLKSRSPTRVCAFTRACTHKSRLVSSGWSTSALPPEAEGLMFSTRRTPNVRFVPEATACGTFTHQNGDSLTMSYTGGWKGNGFDGEYKILSVVGAYAGASGTGAFKSVEEPWQEAAMADVTFKLTLASQ